MQDILKNKDFINLFLGRLITNIGDSIYVVITMWLVYELTKNPIYTGLASAITYIPQAFQFLMGPFIDRWNIKLILIYTQLIEFILVACIPIAYYLNVLNAWMVIVVMFAASLLGQISYPAQTATLPKILKEDELAHGNAIMSFAYQGVDFIFIGMSGILIINFGVMDLFIADCITFLMAAILFTKIKFTNRKEMGNLDQEQQRENKTHYYKRELIEGIQFVKNSFIPKLLIPIIIANALFGMLTAILPNYTISRGGPEYYGYYLAALSIGMLLGSLIGAQVKNQPIGIVIILTTSVSACLWALSYFINQAIVSLVLFGCANLSIGIIQVILFTMYQTLVPENILGRVLTVINSISIIVMPLSAFLGGYLAYILGTNYMFLSGSIGLFFISVYFMVNPELRSMPSYKKIKPEKYILTKVS
ncbi:MULTISPECIES: MFS transporter [Bacillus cereus group]|uniref:MFS transporter n=1 Tax=Bacillus cereus group TaxID=86661 RepID=UPI0009755D33|nr:MFS transporter [Bacillus cereus]ONG95139.1 hypothetical protein BKK45_26345 [Bacillus cereus]